MEWEQAVGEGEEECYHELTLTAVGEGGEECYHELILTAVELGWFSWGTKAIN